MNKKYTPDARNLKILSELDKDARQSNSQIGKKVRLSKEVIKYRIDKMLESGIIVKFYTITNYFKLGIYKYKLYLRFTNASKEKIEEIGQYFLKHKKTEWDVISTGRWDLMVGFLVHNVNEFDDEVQKVMNKFSDYIQEKAVTTTLYLVHNERGFLGSKKSEIVYHTSKDPKEKIDNIDEEIIKVITNNARMPVTEIAEKLKTTPRIIQYRIKEMERKNIILAYKAHLNPKEMGRIFCKAIIYLATTNQEKTNQFISYVSSIPDVVWPMKVMGSWDFELDCEVENYDRFQEIILTIKEKFPDIIKNHEFCIVSKEFKLDFFPGVYPTQ
ncbi:MAG: Lrp/AsnC family transcriptional regulator [Nanoarchaeota archaeon]|nr:Lrp/AsnC family transcriptional regulator [Nanoarchaeota archaeon]